MCLNLSDFLSFRPHFIHSRLSGCRKKGTIQQCQKKLTSETIEATFGKKQRIKFNSTRNYSAIKCDEADAIVCLWAFLFGRLGRPVEIKTPKRMARMWVSAHAGVFWHVQISNSKFHKFYQTLPTHYSLLWQCISSSDSGNDSDNDSISINTHWCTQTSVHNRGLNL